MFFDGNIGSFKDLLCRAVNGPIIFRGNEDAKVGELGIITGGAGSEVEAMVAEGLNSFVTGEGPHWSFPLAEELGLNVFHAGHYATETFGVRVLGELLVERFGLTQSFIDHPTGL